MTKDTYWYLAKPNGRLVPWMYFAEEGNSEMGSVGLRQAKFPRPLHRIWRVLKNTLKSTLKPIVKPLASLFLLIKNWYKSHMPRFMQTLVFRTVSLTMIILIIFSTIGAFVMNHIEQRRYVLAKNETSLIGQSSVDVKLIKTTDDAITYNRAYETAPADIQKVLEIAGKTDATGKQAYSASLSKNASEGIIFGDSEGEHNITMVPRFGLSAPKEEDGQVIYPSGGDHHVYTFKKNGLKNDIIITKKPKVMTKSFVWDLKLGNELEARLLLNGGVGIFSSESGLSDRLSQKSTMLYELPAPFITDVNGHKNDTDVSYGLQENRLTLYVHNLRNMQYPLSIDPTIIVTTTADFQQNIGDSGNTDFNTSGEIRRGIISSGEVGPTTQQSSAFTTARSQHTSVMYNGYLYIVGGYNGSYQNDIQYCPLSAADGSVGTCTQQTSAFTNSRRGHTSVISNGYLYIVGGCFGGSCSSYENDIQYSWIDTATGALCLPSNHATCTGTVFTRQTSAFTTARYGHTSVTYNGYLYIIGGDSGSYQNDIQYCPLNSDGSVGTCTQQTSAFTTARSGHSSVVYNGYLYIVGGYSGSYQNDIQYCPLNSDGSVGTCTQQTTAFTTTRNDHTSVLYNGYLYIVGGYSGSYQNDIQYCPLNSNGSVGTCTQKTGAFTTARNDHTSVVYNGYLYIIGGFNGSTYHNDIQRLVMGQGRPGVQTQQAAAFTTARSSHTSVVYNGYLYIIGGYNGSNVPQNDIQYCLLNSDGSAGTCTQQTAAFTTARGGHTSVAYKGYLYIIGGYDLTTYYNDIQYCPLNSNGSVGTCTQQTAAFTAARYTHKSIVYNGYLYIVGGYDGSSYLNDIQYCPLNSNGSVGTCTQQTSAFTTARHNFASVTSNGYLYIVGGYDGSSYLNDIQYCPLNSNGSVGTCTQQTSAFTTARRSHTSVIYNSYLYIIGGNSGSTQNDIQYCPLNSNGSVGTCTQKTSAFTTARDGHTSIVYNGYLYIIGGRSPSSQNDIQRVRIGPNNLGVGSATQQSAAFTTGRYAHASVTYNGYLYIIGGYSGSYQNDIQYCPLNANGSVGTCTQQTSAFTTARYFHASVAYNGYLYIIGGDSGSYQNDIQYCPLNANGSVGTCTQQTSAFTTARRSHTSIVYNGYLYIIGGYNGSAQNDIQYCPLNSNGSVGTCTQQTSAFTTARFYHSSVIYNGYLYIIGGYTGSVYQNDIQYCPLNSNGSVGTCTQQTSAFTTARFQQTSITYNGYLYIIGGDSGSYQNDIQYCPLNSDGSVGGCTQQASAFTTARSGHTSIAYNGYLYIIGGYNGSYQNDIQRLSPNTVNDSARYERLIDTSNSSNLVTSFTINGTASCSYTVSYKLAGSSNIFGAATIVSNVFPGVAQSISGGSSTRYILIIATLDDTLCGGQSAITGITLSYTTAPGAPTLYQPSSGSTAVNIVPTFELSTADASYTYLRYKIELCSVSNCSSIIRTIDQTSSQTGWLYQNAQTGTAYTGASTAYHTYQTPNLTPLTQYWWRAYAYDPVFTNAWSTASAISTFTTAQLPTVNIGGNINIGGNVIIKP